MYQMYVLTDKKNILILNGNRESFRCRQRNKNMDGKKVKSFRFISYKSMIKESLKNNKKVYGEFTYNTLCKL